MSNLPSKNGCLSGENGLEKEDFDRWVVDIDQ